MVKFINNSNSDIVIEFYGLYNDIKLKPNEKYVLQLNQDHLCFKVSEYSKELSFIMKFLKIVLLISLSIFLKILECFESESIKKNLKFPTKYTIKDFIMDRENEVVIENSDKPLTAFYASLNGKVLNGAIDISEQELKRQVKEYYETELIKFSFPMLALVAFSILILFFSYSTKILISVLFIFIACIPLFIVLRNKRKNKAYIDKLREKYCNSDHCE